MNLAIQVEGHPAGSLAANSAYQFIRAALRTEHRVTVAFFYYDGVYVLQSPNSYTGEDGPLSLKWRDLAAEGEFPLVVCSAASERRGLAATPSPEGFIVGGLGFWVDACLRSDRNITFVS